MLIAHADWSLHPAKRWLAVARQTPVGWSADAPVLVGDLPTLLPRLREQAGDAPLLLGIDTPIGLPAAYAERAGIVSFRDFLAHDLGHGRWADFAKVATHRTEIGLRRPFYPYRPGDTRRRHLVEALGLVDDLQLRRACELASAKRPGILFWTLGANQTGKAALVAWTELIRPSLAADPTVKLWPFDGDLPNLLHPGATVIAETYPAAAMRLLAIPLPRPGKTSQAARVTAGRAITEHCDRHRLKRSGELQARIDDGFGPEKSGEDPFDALLGLLGMIAVATGSRPSGLGAPNEPPHVPSVEGWILGVSTQPIRTEAPCTA